MKQENIHQYVINWKVFYTYGINNHQAALPPLFSVKQTPFQQCGFENVFHTKCFQQGKLGPVKLQMDWLFPSDSDYFHLHNEHQLIQSNVKL